MRQIKQLLQMHLNGQGRKTIARKLGISKTTVKSYLDKLKTMDCDVISLLELDEPVLEAKFHSGNPAYKDNNRYGYIKENFNYFEKELKRPGVTRRLLWEEYRLAYPNGYSYTQFCFHFKQQAVAKNPTMALQHKAAEKLYVDFAGKKMSYIDRNTGEIIECPVFIACLPYSDYGFAIAVRTQGIEDFIYALKMLKPLPDQPFEVKYYKEYKVAKNNHIYLTQDKHYYSVPYLWTGQKAKVIYTRSIVKIYIKGQLVAIHQRNKQSGQYTTVKEHLCSHHRHYLDRSPDYYRQKAKQISENLYKVVDALFNGGRPPEQNYRSCDGLFSLYRKTKPEIFNQACGIAIECNCYSYKYMLRVIENLKKLPKQPEEENQKPLPEHDNIRGRDYYKQTTINF